MNIQKGTADPPFLRNVGMLLTYHCQASCAHCILRAGPERREQINLEDARDWIAQIASYRDRYVYVLSLTGGEPFSDLKLLRSVMEFAVDVGLYVSVTTNGFWAAKREKAKRILQSLPNICFLSVSTDSYHQEFVPYEAVENLAWAAKECGVPFYISVVTEDLADPEYLRLRENVEGLAGPDNVRTGITFPVGRAAEMQDLHFQLSREPCPEVCQASSSPCIFPDGRVYGCIGPLFEVGEAQPLFLGSLRQNTVAEIFDRAETNAVLHALRLWGPSRFVTWLREAGLGAHLPENFVSGSICSVCHGLFSIPAVRAWTKMLAQDPEFQRKVAYGRLFYLKETGMLDCGQHERVIA